MAAVDVYASDLTKQVTINVRLKGLRRMKARFAVGVAIIKLGFWVTGLNGIVEHENDAQG